MFFECTPMQLHQGGLLISLFLGGLVGGFSHCLFMCAPFVVSLQEKTIGRVASILLLPYHLGRMTTYVFLGVCANLFLSYAFPASPLRTGLSVFFLVLAAALFFIQAIPSLGKYMPFLMKVAIPAPLCVIQSRVSRLLEKKNNFSLYLAGILLGFIPCGLIMGALLAASTAENPLYAGVVMMAFALGTIPSLILVAVFGKTLATLLPRGWRLLSRGVLVVNGIILLFLAGLHLS